MKRVRRNRNASYLPEEIIRNILKRLPVKSLIRFQCVCKLWNNLIQNQSFIADHLQHSSHENPSLLLERNMSKIPNRLYTQNCEMQIHEFVKTPSVDYLLGSCNGLLLVGYYSRSRASISLWNPATRAVGHIPFTKKCSSFYDGDMGFGFSPIVNDYKIVRIFQRRAFEGIKRVEMFSLSRGTWKSIDIGVLKGARVSFYEAVTANGAIFWLGETEEGEDDSVVLVSFDIATEVFMFIPIPFNDDDAAYIKLAVYKNKLAILHRIWEDGGLSLTHLWVFDESTCTSGGTCGWAKIYTSRRFSYPMAIWRNEIVFRLSPTKKSKSNTERLYLMNITTKGVKSVHIPNDHPIYKFHGYVESLVSIGNN